MSLLPESFILPHIRQMRGYIPGLQPGLGKKKSIIKLNTNENPFPPSAAVKKALKKALKKNQLHLYPDPLSRQLRQTIGLHYNCSEEYVLAGNGSDEVLSLVFRAVLGEKDSVVFCEPSYSLYPILAQMQLAKGKRVKLQNNWHTDFSALLDAVNEKGNTHKLVVLANPNSPTSIAETRESILSFAKKNPALTLVDEAYAPFWGESLGMEAGSKEYPRLLVCGTFSKAYSLAGQRIGWLIGQPGFILELDKLRDSYNLSFLAQTAALAAWQDVKTSQKQIQILRKTREQFIKELEGLGFNTLPAQANFIFTQPPLAVGTAADYASFLRENKILVRHFPQPQRISSYVRITIGKKEDMRCLLYITKKWIDSKKDDAV